MLPGFYLASIASYVHFAWSRWAVDSAARHGQLRKVEGIYLTDQIRERVAVVVVKE